MSKRALVVDNDFFFVEFLGDLLENRGYEVTKAYDGKEGISKLNEGPIDILFVDMIMPKIDGQQFIEFIRKKTPHVQFPIVIVSSTLIEKLETIHEVGADYYVAKGPMDKMAATLDQFMDKLEEQGLATVADEDLLEPGRVYPREATAELLENLDFERAVLESIGIGIIVVDRDARIINANSSALLTIRKPLEGVLDCHITTIFSKNDHRVQLVSALKKVIRRQETRKVSFSVSVNAHEIHVIVSALKLDGQIVGWVVALEDEIHE